MAVLEDDPQAFVAEAFGPLQQAEDIDVRDDFVQPDFLLELLEVLLLAILPSSRADRDDLDGDLAMERTRVRIGRRPEIHLAERPFSDLRAQLEAADMLHVQDCQLGSSSQDGRSERWDRP